VCSIEEGCAGERRRRREEEAGGRKNVPLRVEVLLWVVEARGWPWGCLCSWILCVCVYIGGVGDVDVEVKLKYGN
jgi:hypothetical protein